MQHKYHTKIDDLIEKTMVSMRTALVGKLISVLEKVLSSLGRYDEGNMMGSILSFAVRIVLPQSEVSKMRLLQITFVRFQNKQVSGKGSNGTGMGKQYMTFVRNNMDQIAKKITDDLWVLGAMEVN